MSNFVNLLDIVYPVGSVYITFNETSPTDTVGGTWELLKNTFLYSSADATGTIGGEKEHALTDAELPSISADWDLRGASDSFISDGSKALGRGHFRIHNSRCWVLGHDSSSLKGGYSGIGFSFGNNQAHNNMPPYITVHMYRRTA